MPRLLVFIYLLSYCLFARPQSNSKLAIGGKLGLGVHAFGTDNFGQEAVFTNPGTYISLEPSLTYRYKNSFSLAARGGLNLCTYSFIIPDVSYSVYYLGWKSEVTASKYIETPTLPFDYLNFGASGGFQFLSDDSLSTGMGSFRGLSYTKASTPFYFAPHIGTFRREDRFSYSLTLTYSYMFAYRGLIHFDMESNLVEAKAVHNGSYLGLNILIDYDLKLRRKDKPTPPPLIVELPEDAGDRDNDKQGDFETKSREIILKVWDHGQEDNDTLSILLNDKVILNKHMISHKKKKIKLTLQKGENIIKVIAHNEGQLKPNSATIQLKSSDNSKTLLINSSLNSNAIINVNSLLEDD